MCLFTCALFNDLTDDRANKFKTKTKHHQALNDNQTHAQHHNKTANRRNLNSIQTGTHNNITRVCAETHQTRTRTRTCARTPAHTQINRTHTHTHKCAHTAETQIKPQTPTHTHTHPHTHTPHTDMHTGTHTCSKAKRNWDQVRLGPLPAGCPVRRVPGRRRAGLSSSARFAGTATKARSEAGPGLAHGPAADDRGADTVSLGSLGGKRRPHGEGCKRQRLPWSQSRQRR